MQLWDKFFFSYGPPTPITKHKTLIFLLDAPIILNTTLFHCVFSHRSLFEQCTRHGCTFKGCSPIQNGCSIIEKHLVIGVLTFYMEESLKREWVSFCSFPLFEPTNHHSSAPKMQTSMILSRVGHLLASTPFLNVSTT